MLLEVLLVLVALAMALFARPWRLLQGTQGLALLTPLLALLVVLPWLWALPALHTMPLQLQWSGACLALLCLGWPLAVPLLVLVGTLACLISPMGWEQAVALTTWQGVVPATLALGLGALLRRFVAHHLFVYVLGRAFLGTVVCLFISNLLAQWAGHTLPGVDDQLSTIAHWLMAWGDGFLTGMLCAIFVAFRPQWLATWSDRLYLESQ